MIQLLPHHFLLFELFRVTDKQEMRWAAGLFPELTMYQVLRGNFKKTKIKTKYISPKHFKRRFLSFVWGWTALILHSFQCMWGCRLLFLNPAKNTLSSQGTEVYSTAVDLQTTSIPLFLGGVVAAYSPCHSLTDPVPILPPGWGEDCPSPPAHSAVVLKAGPGEKMQICSVKLGTESRSSFSDQRQILFWAQGKMPETKDLNISVMLHFLPCLCFCATLNFITFT